MSYRAATRHALALLVVASLLPVTAASAEEQWVRAGATGKYVYRDGSKGKQLEDYNVQSGVDVDLDAGHLWDDGSSFRLQGLGQSGEGQGWVRGEYGDLGDFGLVLDFSRWTEYYNSRDGGDRPGLFPFTNDGEAFYGDGLPSTDWLTTGGAFEVEIGSVLHDVYGDFHYRNVDGDQSLLKGGTLDGTFMAGTLVSDPGTGPTNFGFPGRKDVDYDAYMASAGARSGLLGINWQTDVSYQYHDIEASTFEPSYCSSGTHLGAPCSTGGSLAHADRYKEDTELKVVKYDVTGSRNVTNDLFFFGAGFFSWERSDPEPAQFVKEAATGLTLRTRSTSSGSKVTRFTPAASFGGVYRATRDLVLRADTAIRGHIQEADLDEFRSETALVTSIGDVSVVTHSADRNAVISTTNLQADWRLGRRLSLEGDARYQFRWDDVDTRQDTTLIGDRPEIEKYDQEMHRVVVGPSARYRLRRGRAIEGGYRFTYADVSQDIDALSNQYNLGDYEQLRHRVYAKAGGPIVDQVRGEVRAQYVYETREMDGAQSFDALGNVFIDASSAEAKLQSWSVVPTVHWMPHEHWGVHGTYSIGQTKIEADSGSTFDYEVLTQSVSAGATYRPSDTWSASGSYTFYHNSDDVENIGHNASLSGRVALSERLGVQAGVRYLGFERDSTSLDDYDAVVVSLGLTGEF